MAITNITDTSYVINNTEQILNGTDNTNQIDVNNIETDSTIKNDALSFIDNIQDTRANMLKTENVDGNMDIMSQTKQLLNIQSKKVDFEVKVYLTKSTVNSATKAVNELTKPQ